MPAVAVTAFRGSALFGTTPTRFSISNKALTTNLATLTTSAAHGITAVGTLVTVQGVDSVLDGTYTIHSIPSTTTFTYARVNANITSVAVSPVGIATFSSAMATGLVVTNKVVQNFIATLTTAAHGLTVGDLVAVTIGDTVYDSLQVRVMAVPSATTFCFIVATQTAATTAVTQGSFGRFPAAYTSPAATTEVTSNIAIANPSSAAGTFTISVNRIILHGETLLAANTTAYIDLKQPIATAQTVVIAASVSQITMHISGVEIS